MRSFAIEFHPNVASDFSNSYHWYEMQRPGLGEEFIESIRTTLAVIAQNPETFSTKGNRNFREAQIEKFPYLIVYKIYPITGKIFVASIHHTKQNPKRKYRSGKNE